jgi:hypothetical protein
MRFFVYNEMDRRESGGRRLTMKKTLILVLCAAVAAGIPGAALAQSAAPTQTGQQQQAARVDDLGLRNAILPEDVRRSLNLNATQLTRVAAADEKATKEVAKLTEELKALGDHQHGAGGECPHCALNAKIRVVYTEYHRTLGTILTDAQKTRVKTMMAEKAKQAEAERQRARSGG